MNGELQYFKVDIEAKHEQLAKKIFNDELGIVIYTPFRLNIGLKSFKIGEHYLLLK